VPALLMRRTTPRCAAGAVRHAQAALRVEKDELLIGGGAAIAAPRRLLAARSWAALAIDHWVLASAASRASEH
jgi:hypothetical protein